MARHLESINSISVAASRDIAETDIGSLLAVNSASSVNLQIRLQSAIAWSPSANCFIERHGTGAVQITAESGVTLNGVDGGTISIMSRYSGIWLRRVGTDAWMSLGASGFVSWSDVGTAANQVAPGDIGQRNSSVTASTATTAIDLSGDDEDVLTLTLATATTELGFTNSLDRKRYTLRVVQDATGGRAVTQGASIKTASGDNAEAWPTFTSGTANQYGYLVVVGNAAGGVDFATFTGWYT